MSTQKMPDLTNRERQVYDTVGVGEERRSFAEVGRELGVSKETVRTTYVRAVAKLGQGATDATKPRDQVLELAEEFRIPERIMRAVADRLLGRTGKTEGLKDLFYDKGRAALETLTVEEIKAAKPKDRMIMAGIASDKWLLLDGRPTQRLSVEDRRKLPELLEMLQAEIERRRQALTIDAEVESE